MKLRRACLRSANRLLLPRIVLGHTAFFGVDHLSTKCGADRAAHFSDVKNVVAIVNKAVVSGAEEPMLYTQQDLKMLE